jgi:hypothetical protein
MKSTIGNVAQILANHRGACPVTILAETTPDLVGGKKSPILSSGPITKVTVINGMANFAYEKAVNRVREKEGQPLTENGAVEIFRSEPRVWGCRLILGNSLLPFVHHVKGMKQPVSVRDIKDVKNLPHADELYLELQCREPSMVKYLQAGKEIPLEEIQQYLREKNEGGRQQVDSPVVLRDYKLVNIRHLTFNGQLYELPRTE